MPRWLRVVRGMIGTGLTFAAGVGVVGSMLGLVGLLVGELSARELMEIVAKTSVVAFIVGVAFSGVLALAARGRPSSGCRSASLPPWVLGLGFSTFSSLP